MKDLTKKALLVKVRTRRISLEKKERAVEREIADQYNTDIDQITTKKSLLLKQHIAPLKKSMNKILPTFYAYTLPWRDGGWRLLPVDLYEKFEKEMRKLAAELEEVKEVFAQNYENYKENAKERLGKLYNPLDYPSLDQILSRFNFEVHYEPVPIANDIRVEMNQAEIEKLRQELEKSANIKLQNAMKEVWERVTETLNRLYERLSIEKTENGKKPRLFKSLIENIRELVAVLPALNLTNDARLEEIRKQLDENFAMLSIEELKEDEESRKETAQKAKEILENIENIF